jgi:hypothetical protein
MSRRRLFGFLVLAALAVAVAMPAIMSAAEPPRKEFFILSSLDTAHGRMVLKRPTEVTLVMHVDGQTAYRDEQGKPLAFRDLRSGDTGDITFRQEPGGEPTALLVQLGPMTVQELERRYLNPAVHR